MKPYLRFTKVFPCAIFLFALGMNTNGQVQIGGDIDGENALDESGFSISMPNDQTVAIGAIENAGNGFQSGHVRIFQLSGNAWVQKGTDIDGEAMNDLSGCSVSMPDQNTVAIGAYNNSSNGVPAGHVRVFVWSGNSWLQKGADIDGETAGDYFGYALSMPDNNTIAISARLWSSSGQVSVFTWDGAAWLRKGLSIDGMTYDLEGTSVSMPDANTVALGAISNDGNAIDAGRVRVFEWTGNEWSQKGLNIYGDTMGDYSGWSVSMPDPNVVAIGAPHPSDLGTEVGYVRVFEWSGSNWAQKGSDITSNVVGDQFGRSVCMPDANTIAIAAPESDVNLIDAGFVRMFKWDQTSWVQFGNDIVGQSAFDRCGWSISMPSPNTLAIGAIKADGMNVNAGHVQVYVLPTVSILENNFETPPTIYPNPTTGQLTLDLGTSHNNVNITVRDALGRELSSTTYNQAQPIILAIDGEPGIFFLDVRSDDNAAMIKVVKE